MHLRHVLLLALLLWLPAALVRPPERQQELRVLISGRNMLESGDYHRPIFQNRPRFRKPPMAYWLAAGGMGLTGQTNEAWAGRLFFVLSSIGGLWLLAKIAGPAGVHTALIVLFTYGYWYYAPFAETDMIQITGILLFFYAWQRQTGLLAGLGISFACLSKGPGGFLIPIISLVFLLRFYRPDRKFILATLLTPLVLIGGWILFLIGESSGLDQMQKDLTATFIDTAHTNPWYYYFYTLPLIMFPGFLLIFKKPRNKEQIAPLEHRTAWTWLVVTLILLVVTVSKQRHYALLMAPPAAWLIGMHIQDIKLPRLVWVFPLTLALSVLGSFITMQTHDYRNAAFLKQVESRVHGSPTLHVVGINSAVFDYHLGRHVENIDSAKRAWSRADPGDAIVVIQPRDSWEQNSLLEEKPALQNDSDSFRRRLYIKPVLDTSSAKSE